MSWQPPDSPPDQEQRAETLALFCQLTGIPPLERVTQRGRDPLTTRYTFHFADGREIHIGTVETLMSQAKLNRVFAVTLNHLIQGVERSDWTNAVAALVKHAIDVQETPGEAFEDTVREWAAQYIGQRATTDKGGAARAGDPFTENGHVYIGASGLAKYIRREYSEQVKLPELRQALTDLGLETKHVGYDRHDGTRSSRSYYHGPTDALHSPEDDDR